MEIQKENCEYRNRCIDTDFGVIPADKQGAAQRIAVKYMLKNIYKDVAVYVSAYDYFSTCCPSKADFDRTKYVIDLNTCNQIAEEAYLEKYKDFKVQHLISRPSLCPCFIKVFVEEDILVVCMSEMNRNIGKSRHKYDAGIVVKRMFFVFKNKTVIEAKYDELSDDVYFCENCLEDVYDRIVYEDPSAYFKTEWMDPADRVEMVDTLRQYFGVQYDDGKLMNPRFKKDINAFIKSEYRKKEWQPDEEVDALNALITDMEVPDDIPSRYIKFEKHGNVTAIRFLKTYLKKQAFEIYRIFLKDGVIISLKNTGCYGFVRTTRVFNKNLREWRLKDSHIPNEVDDFKYYVDLFNSDDIVVNVEDLLQMKTNPVIERLCKTGMETFAIILLANAKRKNIFVESAVETFVGKTGSGESLYSYLGINKHQYKKMFVPAYTDKEKRYTNNDHLRLHIRIIKYILGMDNISCINDKKFDILFDLIEEMPKIPGAYAANTPQAWMYETLDIKKADNDKINVYFQALKKAYEYYGNLDKAVELIKYSYMADGSWLTGAQLKEGFEVADELKSFGVYKGDPFKDAVKEHVSYYYKIGSMHGKIYKLYKYYKDAIAEKAYKEIRKKQEELYVYSNNMYSVISPETPGELLKEGTALSHCVGDFVNEVTAGHTNILFLRKNQNRKKPFFTIEVRGKTVIQIHGKGNRNVDTVEGLEDFVEEWMKAKKLRTKDYDVLNGVGD